MIRPRHRPLRVTPSAMRHLDNEDDVISVANNPFLSGPITDRFGDDAVAAVGIAPTAGVLILALYKPDLPDHPEQDRIWHAAPPQKRELQEYFPEYWEKSMLGWII